MLELFARAMLAHPQDMTGTSFVLLMTYVSQLMQDALVQSRGCHCLVLLMRLVPHVGDLPEVLPLLSPHDEN